MKKIVLSFVFIFSCLSIFADNSRTVSFCTLIDGYWGEWEQYSMCLTVKQSSVSEYHYSDHPSQYRWKFTKSTSTPISYDNGWEVYNGTFEYYITDEYPNIKSLLLISSWVSPSIHRTEYGETPCVKRTVNATIKVKKEVRNKDVFVGYNFWGNPKYKKEAYKYVTYNVYFENVGIGIAFDENWGN